MNGEDEIKVWDIGVRVFHWSLVVLFFISYVSGDEESLLHVYSGYGVLGLVVFRVVWGVVGTKYARFSNFIVGPKTAALYARSLLTSRPVHYLGHNPIGGWMVIALLILLIATSWSGLVLYGAEGHGPLANQQVSIMSLAHANGDDNEERDDEGDEFWEEIHEALAQVTLLFVFMHIGGVLIGSMLHRENLIKAMVTGYKNKKGF
jgi:cytochrome b